MTRNRNGPSRVEACEYLSHDRNALFLTYQRLHVPSSQPTCSNHHSSLPFFRYPEGTREELLGDAQLATKAVEEYRPPGRSTSSSRWTVGQDARYGMTFPGKQ
jgi:hypothetical protein